MKDERLDAARRVRVRVRVRGRRARELGRDLLDAREARADEGALHEQAIHRESGASDVPLALPKRDKIQTDKQLFQARARTFSDLSRTWGVRKREE